MLLDVSSSIDTSTVFCKHIGLMYCSPSSQSFDVIPPRSQNTVLVSILLLTSSSIFSFFTGENCSQTSIILMRALVVISQLPENWRHFLKVEGHSNFIKNRHNSYDTMAVLLSVNAHVALAYSIHYIGYDDNINYFKELYTMIE